MRASVKPDIILLSYYFPPNQAIGGARLYRFYKYLERAGYRCHVVTASDQNGSSSSGVSFVPDSTAGFWQAGHNGDLPVNAHIERAVRKALLPGSLGLSWSFAAAQRCRTIIRRNRDRRFVLISSFPPIGALLAGFWTAFSERVPWISDLRDPLPARAELNGSPMADAAVRRLEALAFRTPDAVIANTGPAAEMWRRLYPRAESKIHVIWNGFDAEQRPFPSAPPSRSYRVLVHTGAMYGGRNANAVVESLSRLREVQPEARDIRIALVGEANSHTGVRAELYSRAEKEDWLDYRPKNVPKCEAMRLTAESDLLLLLQPQSAVQVPGKLFEYICLGKPILALVPPGSASEQILNNAGIPHVCMYPGDEPGAADRKLLEFLRLPSGPVPFSPWFESNFDAASQASQLASIIEAISRNRP